MAAVGFERAKLTASLSHACLAYKLLGNRVTELLRYLGRKRGNAWC